MMKFETLLALRYLRSRRKQRFISLISFLSMAGVGLGVCALIVVLSVMGGFENEVQKKILGQNAHVLLFKAGRPMESVSKVLKIALSDPQVQAAAPFVYGQVMLVGRDGASGVLMHGIKLPQALKVLDLERVMVRGKIKNLAKPDAQGLPGVVLGQALASRLGASLGTAVKLINPLGEDTPLGRVPKTQPFRVVGIFQSGMYQYDSSICYVSLKTAQEFFALDSAVSGVELRVKDIYQAADVGGRITSTLGPLYYARDWINTNQSLFSALKLEKFALFIILNLIVLVAAFGIISSLIMMVMEKTKDIAILKAMGATARSIRKVFMVEGLIIGSCGTVLGAAGGLFLCWLLSRYKIIELSQEVYPMSTLPVQVDFVVVFIICVCAVAISLLATLYPARVAGGQDPVEALRYQ
jgi:lipoprotein-releasing system permease protein